MKTAEQLSQAVGKGRIQFGFVRLEKDTNTVKFPKGLLYFHLVETILGRN